MCVLSLIVLNGIVGMNINEDYARLIYHQQCLYLSKGIADYVAFFHASEFLTLHPPLNSIQELLTRHVTKDIHPELYIGSQQQEKSMLVVTNNERNAITRRLKVSKKDDSSTSPCFVVIQSLGVPDREVYHQSTSRSSAGRGYHTKQRLNHGLGPSDSYWLKDFFNDSQPIGPLPAWNTIGK